MIEDPEILQGLLLSRCVDFVSQHLGDVGIRAVRQLVRAVRDVYTYLDPIAITGTFAIRHSLGSRSAAEMGPRIDLERLPDMSGGALFEISASGTLHLVESDTSDARSEGTLLYVFVAGAETLFAGMSARHDIENLYVGAHSAFCVPTFFEVEDALRAYANTWIRTSYCLTFKEAWLDDECRTFFKPGPEFIMRRSLERFLHARLRASPQISVLPEQIVDESKPVDILVDFRFANRIVLIEIKWLGKSLNEQNNVVAYSDARARAGLSQLAGYLNLLRERRPSTIRLGYLVVIDGRRRNLQPGTSRLSRSDGFAYEQKAIDWKESTLQERLDMGTPFRMFAEPICVD